MVTIEHVHAASNQKRSRSGVMAKYMCESENIGYRTTRSNLRTVNGQGIDIALRNRGCMQFVIDPTRSHGYQSPRGPIRVASTDARANQNKDRTGNMAEVMERNESRINGEGSSTVRSCGGAETGRISRGVKGDSARENSTKGHEGVMRSVLQYTDKPIIMQQRTGMQSSQPISSLNGILGGNQFILSSTCRRVKPEAQDNYSRSQGVAMLSLIQNTTHRQPPHASRVRPEAAGSAFRGHDSHVFKGSPKATPRARIKPEAEDIALKNRGTIGNLMVS